MQNVATNQVRLIADGSRAGSSETDTTCDCTRSEFFHIKLEKCFFVHVFISAECEQCDKHIVTHRVVWSFGTNSV